MKDDFVEKRRAPRVIVEGRFGSNIRAVIEASLLDLSTTGALIEHIHVLHPGSTYNLTIFARERELVLKCRVVRSFVSHSKKTETGETVLIYKSGLEFIEPKKEDVEWISQLVKSLSSGGGVSIGKLRVYLEMT